MYSVYENIYLFASNPTEMQTKKQEYLSGAALILPSFALTSTSTSTSTTQTRTNCSQLAVGLLTAVGLLIAVGLLTAVSLLTAVGLLTTVFAFLSLEVHSIAHLSKFCDFLAKDLMHRTYSFISTNTAAAVASCAGFLTGFQTRAVMCFSHGGVWLVWMSESDGPGMSPVSARLRFVGSMC